MKGNIRILSFGARLSGRPSEIATVPSDERPVLLQNEPLQFPILPASLTQPRHMGALGEASVAGESRQVGAETFVDQKLGNHVTLQSAT